MACTLRLLLTCRRSLTSLGGFQLCACACLPLPASGLQRTHPRPCSARGLLTGSAPPPPDPTHTPPPTAHHLAGAEGTDHVRAYPSSVIHIGRAGEEPLVIHPAPRIMFHGLGGVRVEPGPSAPWDGREREAFKHGAVAGIVTTLVVVKIVAPYVCRAFARLACRLVGQ